MEVLDPGLINRDAGPDFFNAKIKIGGVLWVGNVELHRRASDWFRHGHERDPAYAGVILHVVEVEDALIPRPDGELIPQLILKVPPHVEENYRALAHPLDLSRPACAEAVVGLPVYIVLAVVALPAAAIGALSRLASRRAAAA